MYYYIKSKLTFRTRKELKDYLGGSYAFNKEFKKKNILIFNSVADYGIQSDNKRDSDYKRE